MRANDALGGRRSIGTSIIALIVIVAVALRAGAQSPAPSRMPPVTGSLSGVVRDIAGAPLPDVDVTLVGEALSTRTDIAGAFVLRDVPVGTHTTLFRRIGYRSVEYRWLAEEQKGLQIAVTMTPVPRRLERVVVEAPGTSRHRGTSSIGGSVTDSSGRAVVGADVRLLGSGLSTITDSSGGFEFQQLAAGSYIVRARRAGLSPGSYVMQIADDDSRGISIKLYGLPKKTAKGDTAIASGYGFADLAFDAFDHRARTSSRYPMLGPADLFRQNRASLEMVLQQYRDESAARMARSPALDEPRRYARSDGLRDMPDGDCLIVDGRQASFQPLHTFTSVEVQMVEVFRRNAFVDDYVVAQMEGLRDCRGTMDRHPAYFVLWTRRLR